MAAEGYVPNTAQRRLAEEVTRFVHGEEGLAQVGGVCSTGGRARGGCRDCSCARAGAVCAVGAAARVAASARGQGKALPCAGSRVDPPPFCVLCRPCVPPRR